MIRKLFIIDGLAGTGKSDLISYIEKSSNNKSKVIYKYTTRVRRALEEAEDNDLKFVSEDEFAKYKSNSFYTYSYAGCEYGFHKEEIYKAFNDNENVFIIIRDRNLMDTVSSDFATSALIIPLFIYTDRASIESRLKHDGFNDEQIKFRLDRSEISWKDYLSYPDGTLRVIINNSSKEDFYRKINSLLQEFSTKMIDKQSDLFINPSTKFELMKPLVGFKSEIVEQIDKFPYEKNIFLMMKFRDNNLIFYEFIKRNIEIAGYNCVRADDKNWNITGDIYNPLAVLYCCKYGIALFDEPEEGQNFSPNVAYELGIMHYQGKKCLMLKHSSLPDMPFDLIKNLRKNYTKEIEFEKLFTEWMEEIKIHK